ncbi:MAG: hypothetical protein QF435_16670 [Arenicellales bacterium]|jgi:hypothetical protein|nr:hypothetical protein [Arenicellales bacterium]
MMKILKSICFTLVGLTAIGCVEVGQTTGGVEVCTGDTAECGDNHDESTTTETTTTDTTD